MKINDFYLGSHQAHWLGYSKIPLFVSHRILRKRKTFPQAVTNWALDSGGFSELSLYGTWTISPKEYAGKVQIYSDEIGKLDWCAIQDWMCEPFITAKTGFSVLEHQKRSVQSYLDLMNLAPHLPFTPVLQGWEFDDYLRHIELYDQAGINLFDFKVVGLGSVCRRQSFKGTQELIRHLYGIGLKMHGFGVKLQGLKQISECLVSADSMAWSYDARNKPPIQGHTHKNCANCFDYACLWHKKVGAILSEPKQSRLFYAL